MGANKGKFRGFNTSFNMPKNLTAPGKRDNTGRSFAIAKLDQMLLLQNRRSTASEVAYNTKIEAEMDAMERLEHEADIRKKKNWQDVGTQAYNIHSQRKQANIYSTLAERVKNPNLNIDPTTGIPRGGEEALYEFTDAYKESGWFKNMFRPKTEYDGTLLKPDFNPMDPILQKKVPTSLTPAEAQRAHESLIELQPTSVNAPVAANTPAVNNPTYQRSNMYEGPTLNNDPGITGGGTYNAPGTIDPSTGLPLLPDPSADVTSMMEMLKDPTANITDTMLAELDISRTITEEGVNLYSASDGSLLSQEETFAQLNNYDTALKDVSELEAPSAWQSQFQSKDYVNPSAFKEFKAGVMGRGWQDTGVAAGDGFFQKGTGLDYDVGLGDVIAIGDFVYRAMENDWTDEWSDEDTKTSLHMAADVIFFLPIPGARVVSGLIHGVTSLWDWLD